MDNFKEEFKSIAKQFSLILKLLEEFNKDRLLLQKRVKRLEQKDSYYPTQEEINNIKEVRNING